MADDAEVRGPANAPSTKKRALGIPENERRDLLDILLRINKVAMHAFDCIEADAWSMDDLYVMLALPDTCNEFTAAMTRHARRLGEARR